ncbi:hypothetical protein E0Z10_g694 [Xylaria hypoxylon]|uniref:BZIP domain-containing protein n=1 Tax=Xylaria hypoxylon TaxID=37992 RepID=A0A4Z0ZEI6_9PEZI|nr:hypothetical protein E0Z10_g694 [Xylaria hypoxylon]
MMDGSSHSMASRRSSPGVDPLELLDLSEYDTMSYHSPSISPSATNKMQFARTTPTIATTPATMPTNQMLSGPSHQYDQYKQQTPFVPGALASTLAINESNAHINGYNMDYINPGEELFDFNATPQNSMMTPDMDLDFDSPAEPAFFFPQGPALTLHTGNSTSPVVPTQASAVGRMYPGMHQRAALAKAQAQAQAQQQIQMQQQQHEMSQRQQVQQRRHHQSRPSRAKLSDPADPIVEQKITQLLNSMRTKVNSAEPEENSPLLQIARTKKEEDEMDEDERLLASEEGKKLSSKERRQLRNKVSARAFRSRRKEYIGQLENEIAGKVTENNDLRAENKALAEENKRMSELTRMLLASPSFSGFLERLSSNPALVPQAQPQIEQRQPEQSQAPKDSNPYNAMNMGQQQQIGMVMIPEQRMDFSMLNMSSDGYAYQPQVFTVFETPELPEINTEALTGKTSNFVGESMSDNDKTDAPSLEAPVPSMIEKPQVEVNLELAPAEKTVSNLDGDIFDDDDGCSLPSLRPLELDTDGFSAIDIFGGIDPEKAFARYELIDSSEEEKVASMAARRVERLAANLAATISRLERLDL